MKFPKAGSYTYYCDVHPGMKGKVKVVAKSKPVPSAKADAKKLDDQVARALSVAKALPKTKPAGRHSRYRGGRQGRRRVLRHGAQDQTVPVGTTLTFRMSPGTYEDHTATFGPGDPEKEPTSYLGTSPRASRGRRWTSRGVYPSEAPGTIASLTPDPARQRVLELGSAGRLECDAAAGRPTVTFAAPGTYNFICLIHPS